MNNNEIDKKLDDLMDSIIDNNVQEYDKDKIENELNEILKVDPNNTRALWLYGLYYTNFEEYQKALDCYDRILQYATDKKEIEDTQSYIKDCKELMELQVKDNNLDVNESISQNYSNCNAPNLSYKAFEKLSPITLLVVKIIILLVIFLLLNKYTF